MTVDKSSVSRKQKKKMKSPHKGKTKSRKNFTPSPRTSAAGSRNINSNSSNGKTKNCHQCQHFKGDSVAVWCTNQTGNRRCPIMYCHKCLMNRYGEKAEEVAGLGKWSCPKCRGICNCSVCMKRRGHAPTGILIHKAKAAGFSCVSEMLIKKKNVVSDVVIAPAKVPKPRCSIPDQSKQKALTSVSGIDMASEQVGNALQFLEFCAVFGKILDFKKGEPEYVLQDLQDGESGGKFSATVQFHIYLLQIIQKERGEEFAGISSNGKLKSSWFEMLKKLISGSQSVLKAQGFNCLDNKADYETLDSSEKLMLLNLLCDEVLETKKVKVWVGGQSRKNAAKDKDKSLKRTRGHDIDNAVIPGYQSTDTLRTDPVFKQQGYVFWKLNALGESDILCQNVGKGDALTLDEKWSSVNAAGKEAIEKHICLSREQKKSED